MLPSSWSTTAPYRRQCRPLAASCGIFVPLRASMTFLLCIAVVMALQLYWNHLLLGDYSIRYRAVNEANIIIPLDRSDAGTGRFTAQGGHIATTGTVGPTATGTLARTVDLRSSTAGRGRPTAPAMHWSDGTDLPNHTHDWNPVAKMPAEFLELLNNHSARQRMMCRGAVRPISAVVYYCQRRCYALADGLRGMLVAYAFAVATERAFLINSPQDFPVTTYFDVGKNPLERLDWRLDNCSSLRNLSGPAKTLSLHLPKLKPHFVGNVTDLSLAMDFNCSKLRILAQSSKQLPDIVLMHTNQISACALSLLNKYNSDHGLEAVQPLRHGPVFRPLFDRLFHFKPETVEDVQQFSRKHAIDFRRSVCLHIRVGGFEYDWNFRSSTALRDYVSCGLNIEKLIRSEGFPPQGSPIPWVVVSDNQTTAGSIGRLLRAEGSRSGGRERHVIHTNDAGVGPIVHLMEANNPANSATFQRDGSRRVLFDFHLLSRCKYLVMGRSGYAGLAVVLGEDWSGKEAFGVGEPYTNGIPEHKLGRKRCIRTFPGM